MAQSIKRPTLVFSSGHDLMVHEIEPHVGFCTGGTKPTWDSLFPSHSAPSPFVCVHAHALSLSLSQNK